MPRSDTFFRDETESGVTLRLDLENRNEGYQQVTADIGIRIQSLHFGFNFQVWVCFFVRTDSGPRGTQDIILKHRVGKLRQGLLGHHPPKSGTLTLIIFYKRKYKKYIYALQHVPFFGISQLPMCGIHKESSIFATSSIVSVAS